MTAGTNNELEIVCPELFSRVPEDWISGSGDLLPLETLLSRADCATERPGGLERNLCRRFGIGLADDEEVPAGALSLLAEGVAVDAHYWLRAHPVHLHADRDRLVLFALTAETLGDFEASGYVDAFNAHFSREGWQLVAPRPTRWYLRAPCSLAVTTRPLSDVDGKNLEPFLPSGTDAPMLRRLVAEAEMLMHEFFSAGRVGTPGGRVPNSLWFSGGGPLPRPGDCRLAAVAADDLLVQGLARNAGLKIVSPADPVPRHGRVLCYLDAVATGRRRGDMATHATGLRQVAAQVAAALTRVRRGEQRSLCLSDGSSRCCCSGARQLRRWWRRRREYRCFLE